MIQEWWKAHGEVPPIAEMLPCESTFIVEDAGIPALCVTVIMTNTTVAWVDNLVASPAFNPSAERKLAVAFLNESIEGFCRVRGYTKLFCMAHKEGLVLRYNELGYKKTCENIRTFLKEIA